MQSLVSVILAINLAICPLICEPGDAGCGDPRGGADAGAATVALDRIKAGDRCCDGGDRLPAAPRHGDRCPDGRDHCVCQGALHPDAGPRGLAGFAGPSTAAVEHRPVDPAASADSPPSRRSAAPPGCHDARTLRAMLQAFRC